MTPDAMLQRLEQVRKEITMYVSPNLPTKKALKEAIKNGDRVVVFAPGLGSPRVPEDSVEGPHYPKPHSWYARVETKLDEATGEVVVVKVKA